MTYGMFRQIGLAMALAAALAAQQRPYVNDMKVPESRKDLEFIQTAVTSHLERSRAATVCIQVGEGSGTGVVVSADGLVMTAAHVTADVNKKVKLLFEDGTEVEGLTLGLDSECDAAMIQITSPVRKDWPFVELERTDQTRVGDWVVSLGHSGGFNKERGLVVRVGRIVKAENETFQSDCILIGGDSGGPLFDLDGKLIGIHSRVGAVVQENMHVPTSVYLAKWEELKKGEFLGEGPFAKRKEKGSGYLGLATEPRKEGGIVVTKVGQ
ncbi:MAG TPA: serine protease, partial [Luteolibacter sp.]|nr:serine protease [Luteolibacter sp.]